MTQDRSRIDPVDILKVLIVLLVFAAGIALLTASGNIRWGPPEGAKFPDTPPFDFNMPPAAWIILSVFGGIGTLCGLAILYLRQRQRAFEFRENLSIYKREAEALESAVDKLRDQMLLPSLMNLNRILLDQYHRIATDQAESSFKSSKRAMWCGFAWLLMCFTAAILIPATKEAQLLVGTLAATGGALSGFLGRTYIRVYERSLQQLNRYFEQPLVNSYLLSAERIVGEMDEGQDEAYKEILRRLLSLDNSDRAGAKRVEPSAGAPQ
jgi:hypothetical protein